MEQNSGRETSYLYKFWLLLCAAGCLGISLYGEKMLPSAWIGKLCGIFACVLMVILSAVSFATGDAAILGLTDPDAGQKLSKLQCRKAAAAACVIFLTAAAAEAAYAYYGLYGGHMMSLMEDALITAAIYTAASLTARKLLAVMTGKKEPEN